MIIISPTIHQTYALEENAKRCHIVNSCHSPSWRGLQRLQSADDVATEWLVNALDNNSNYGALLH